MAGLSVRLLGSFRLCCDADGVSGLESGKAQELLGYLLLHRNRAHPREALAGVLWGECPTAQARKQLRQALWQIQTALGARSGVAVERFLTVSSESVRLDAVPGLWLDIAAVEDAYMSVRGVPGEALGVEQAVTLREAVRLYDGDLLEGWYQDWCVHARTALQHAHLVMLDKLMAFCETHGAYEDGVAYGDQILRCDVARERTHRRLMRLHYLAGDRTAALRQFERCRMALDEELGVAPARSTLALLAELRADRLSDPPPRPPVPTVLPAEPASLPEVIVNLRQLQGLLVDVHTQLQHDIQTIEVAHGAD